MDTSQDYNKKLQEAREKYLREVIQPSFPFIKHWTQSTVSGNEFSIEISTRNEAYKKSKYCYEYFDEETKESVEFIHYTSIRNAINILNEGFFRANDFTYFDDPQELLFAGKYLMSNLDDVDLVNLKRKLFAISSCEYSQKEEFDLWRLYGDNGNGIAIVFEFLPYWWQNCHISRIYYEENKLLESIKQFCVNHKKFQIENDIKIKNSDYHSLAGKLPEWIALFLAFHKSSIYQLENEVRFIYFDSYPAQFPKSPLVKGYTINSNYEKSAYYNIPILSNSNLQQLNNSKGKHLNYKTDAISIGNAIGGVPIIKIKKMILGYRCKQFSLIGESIKDIGLTKEVHPFEVIESKLSKEFVS